MTPDPSGPILSDPQIWGILAIGAILAVGGDAIQAVQRFRARRRRNTRPSGLNARQEAAARRNDHFEGPAR